MSTQGTNRVGPVQYRVLMALADVHPDPLNAFGISNQMPALFGVYQVRNALKSLQAKGLVTESFLDTDARGGSLALYVITTAGFDAQLQGRKWERVRNLKTKCIWSTMDGGCTRSPDHTGLHHLADGRRCRDDGTIVERPTHLLAVRQSDRRQLT